MGCSRIRCCESGSKPTLSACFSGLKAQATNLLAISPSRRIVLQAAHLRASQPLEVPAPRRRDCLLSGRLERQKYEKGLMHVCQLD